MRLMTLTLLACAAAAVILPELAIAQDIGGGSGSTGNTDPKMNVVPEIDALAGLAAVGAVGAVVALIRERTKR